MKFVVTLKLGSLFSKTFSIHAPNICCKVATDFMSLIFPTRARNALRTDEWRCVLASGIDMKSAQPQSRKMENKEVGVNELLMPCSAHYMAYVSC